MVGVDERMGLRQRNLFTRHPLVPGRTLLNLRQWILKTKNDLVIGIASSGQFQTMKSLPMETLRQEWRRETQSYNPQDMTQHAQADGLKNPKHSQRKKQDNLLKINDNHN